MLIQLIEGAVIGITTLSMTKGLCKKAFRKKVDDGTLKWLWGNYAGWGHLAEYGFRCPKCCAYRNNKAYYICLCAEYHKEHFHFRCNDCGYTNIMRTADDK